MPPLGTTTSSSEWLRDNSFTRFPWGSITGYYGVRLNAGGGITNQDTGTIRGSKVAVYAASGAGTVVNAGTISAGTFAVKLASGAANRVVVKPGALFIGKVSGGNTIGATAVSALELAGTQAGTLTGFGSQYVGFNQVTIDSGASWTLTGGSLGLAVTVGGSGTLTNAQGDTIANPSSSTLPAGAGVYLGAAATLINAGSISGQYGIGGASGSSVTNQSTGTVTAVWDAVKIVNGAGSVVNAGRLAGGAGSVGAYLKAGGSVINSGSISGRYGVKLWSGGSLTNQSAGTISGGFDAVKVANGAGTVVNAGRLSGGALSVGAYLLAGGSVVNTGSVSGKYGVRLNAGGSVTNQGTGAISGTAFGVYAKGAAATVVNTGTVSGGTYAVKLAAGFDNRVVIDPVASFSGKVSGGNTVGAAAVSTLELASATAAGTLSGFGSQYTGFNRFTVDAGASWTLTGGTVAEEVTLGAGATLTNAQGNTIAGPSSVTLLLGSGVYLAPAATLVNAGSISGYYGVGAGSASSVTNLSTGLITGFWNGVRFVNGPGTLVNAGSISGSYGVRLSSGGSLTNQSTGTISGSDRSGAFLFGGSVVNAGSISGFQAVRLIGTGSVINQSAGRIYGVRTGIYGGGDITVLNAGRLVGGTLGTGIYLRAGGSVVNTGSISGNYGVQLYKASVTNQGTGAISGTTFGIYSKGGAATVVNAGTVSGGTFAVKLASGFANRLVIDPGASFSGKISGGNAVGGAAVSTLELASATAAGTLSGFGSQYTGFNQFTVDAGASWTLSGGTVAEEVKLGAGATLTNAQGNTIAGPSSGTLALGSGVYLAPAATLVNAGSISGDYGVGAGSASSVTNLSTGLVTGFWNGVSFVNGPGTLVNAGSISGSYGVMLLSGGSLTNQSTGTISGSDGSGAFLFGGSVVNAGSISGYRGVRLIGTGSVINQSAGRIYGVGTGLYGGGDITVLNAGRLVGGTRGSGVYLRAGGSVVNTGSISGNYGVQLYEASVTNQATGAISGTTFGIYSKGRAATVVNAGTVSGGTFAVKLASGFANRLVVNPGASFSGKISGGNAVGGAAVSTLELASATAAGTLSGFGSQYTGFNQFTVDAGASWALTGGTVAEEVTVGTGGTLTNAQGNTIAGPSSGTLALGSGVYLAHAATLVNAGSISGQYGVGGGYASSVTNQGSGMISGGLDAIKIVHGAGTIVNAGRLAGGTFAVGAYLQAGGSVVNSGSISGSYGVKLSSGGNLTNQSAGTISGGLDAVKIVNAAGTVVNAGRLAGTFAFGVYLSAGGSVVNTGSISGYEGVGLSAGGSVTNQGAGAISGTAVGIVAQGGATTVVNAGAIGGGSYAVFLLGDFANRLVIDPGASFSGKVLGSNAVGAAAVNTLELANGTQAGTLTGFGSQYVGFNQVTIDPGASWTLADGSLGQEVTVGAGGTLTNALGDTIANPSGVNATVGSGVYLASAATLVNAGSISGYVDGVVLSAGGSVINQGSGSIVGTSVGISAFGAPATIVNGGTIAGSLGAYLGSGGTIINQGAGSILGNNVPAIYARNAPATVVNAGTIAGYGGVNLAPGGSVTNQSGGRIDGGYGVAVYAKTAGVTVVNTGTITGASGVVLLSGGSVTNQGFGGIYGQSVGIFAQNAAAIVNGAKIGGGESGVYLQSGSSVTNQSTGTIAGSDGVDGHGAAVTVVNAGVIRGVYDAVKLAAGYANRLVIDPGASFSGQVSGGNTAGAAAVSTLELAAGTVAGTLTGLGSQFVGFTGITIDSGAAWTLTGANAVAAGYALTNSGSLTTLNGSLAGAGTLTNNGAILIDPSTVTLGALTGTGAVTVAASSTLEVTGAIAAGETIVLAGAQARLQLDTPSAALGQIAAIAPGETIDLRGVGLETSAVPGSNNTLVLGGGTSGVTLHVDKNYTGTQFALISDGAGGTLLTAVCFLPGTKIRTVTGEVAVERIKPGDLVRTWAGRVRPVTWVGSGKMLSHPGKRSIATPVIVRRNALADGVPSRDLRVTKGHSLFVDDVLIPVEFLVNDRSITWDDHAREVTYYHIELDAHDILIADGAPAESYRDDGNRRMFASANPAWDAPPLPPCAPVLTGGPAVDAAWRRLLARCGPAEAVALTDDPDLHLVADGRRLDALARIGKRWMFRVPFVPTSLQLVSGAASPAQLGLARDPRVLGVAVSAIFAFHGVSYRVLQAEDDRLVDGFHAYEPDCGWRWTDGNAEVPAALFRDLPAEFWLHVTVPSHAQYRSNRRAA